MSRYVFLECGAQTAITGALQVHGPRRVTDVTAQQCSLTDDRAAKAMVDEIFSGTVNADASVALIIPRNTVTVRNLHIPMKTSAEAESMIELQLSRVMPHKKEDIVYGYRISGKDKMGYARVIVAVVLKDQIRAIVSAFDKVDHLPDAVVLSSCEVWKNVIATASDLTPKDGLFAVIDVGAEACDYIVATREHIMFTGTVAVTAEQLETDEGVEACLTQMEQSRTVFSSEEFSMNPTMLFVTGIYKERLVERLKGSTHGEVIELFHRTSAGISAGKQYLAGRFSFTPVLGLCRHPATDSLYFRVPEIEAKRMITERSRELIVLGALLMFGMTLIVMGVWSAQAQRVRYLDRLVKQNAVISSEIGEISREAEASSYVVSILEKRREQTYAMYALDALLASETKLSYVALDESGGYTIRGQAKDSSQVFALVARIEDHPAFSGAEEKYARRKQTPQGEVTDFEIRFSLDPSGVQKKAEAPK